MPVNIWKDSMAGTPKENLNWRLWYAIFVFVSSQRFQKTLKQLINRPQGLMGAARGIDEGLIGTSSTLKPFRLRFGLDEGSEVEQAQLLSNIASMVQMGSILGALIACVITGKLHALIDTVTGHKSRRTSAESAVGFLLRLMSLYSSVWTKSNASQDRIGRVWATRELCLVWAFGIGIFMAASKTGNVGMVLGGRFLAGVGIG